MKIPKVFISYSHDNQEHKKWVMDLAIRLRNSGIDAIIDQWELKPGDDLPHFMETQLASSDRVLMVCTDRYVTKANSGSGGVGYEKMIITSDLLKGIDSNKVIPIIRQSGTHEVPTFLKTKLFINFSKSDDYEFSFDELIRALHNAPLFIKPPIGNTPFTPIENTPPERSGDSLRELMSIVIGDFEMGHDSSSYRLVLRKIGISRVYFDMLIDDAIRAGLITQDIIKSLHVTQKGKNYAIQHKLLK